MKKFIVDYIHIIAMTLTGLLFGLSFFLLFLNFYHVKEVSYSYTPSESSSITYEKMLSRINTIQNNASVYNQSNYQGSEDAYEMLGIQSKLNNCVKKYQEENLKKLFSKKSYLAKDVFELLNYYQNNILNGCVVLQMYNLVDTDQSTYKSDQLKKVAPFLKLEIDSLLNNGLSYVRSNLKNNDIYYFSNDDSKNTVFELTRDSYQEVLSNYTKTLDFLETFSTWYKDIVLGG